VVLTAATPAIAIEMAAKHGGEIDLLLTDVVMPGMNGAELARRLQESRPTLRRLFMSGYTADAIAHRGVLDEGVQFLQKPFSRDDLARTVRTVLGRPGSAVGVG
jgi:YesN/AraC family two-component response regulator